MAEDWYADVNKHAPGADANVVRKIVNHCGIALRNRDSQLVSFGDAAEVGRVRERFLRKKLGLLADDKALDQGIAAVRDHMAADRTKNRVTVYYLLADWFGKHDLFGGSASAPGSFSFAQAITPAHEKPKRVRKPAAVAAIPAATPVAPPARKAKATAAGAAATAPATKTAASPAVPSATAAAPRPISAPAPTPAPAAERQSLYSAPEGSAAQPMYIGYKDVGGAVVWPHWSAIAALLVAVIAAAIIVRAA